MMLSDAAVSAPERTAGVRQKIFLATPAQFTSNSIGALFLRDLIASQPEIDFIVHEEPPFLMGGGSAMRTLRAALTRLPTFHAVRLRWFRSRFLKKRAAVIAAAADVAQADCMWVTASSPEMIWIADLLAGDGRDVRVTVWDAPEYLSGNLRLDMALHEMLMGSFGSLLRRARVISVIGRTMQKDYLERYGVCSEIIRHGIDADLAVVGREPRIEGPVRIVFAGSLYSKTEWNSFVEALDEADWQVAGRPVLLYFMGRFPLSDARKAKHLVLLGEKPFDEALKIMASMDIGYLPYWFDKRHEIVARTSFPGKLSAYAAAGLAVFHHAPSYTEATGFLRNFPFGLSCDSLEAGAVMDALTRLVALLNTDACRRVRQAAVCDELSQQAMASRFQRFLAGLPV